MAVELAPEPKVAVASWSFHEEFEDPLVDPRFTPQEFMEICAEKLGIRAVEFLYTHLTDSANPEHPPLERLQQIKDRAAELGVQIICLAVHNDFVNRNARDRNSDIDYVVRCIETAHEFSAGLVRINAGISRCSAEVIPLFIDSVRQVTEKSPYVGFNGPDRIGLVLENQGGITQDAYNLMDIMLRAEAELGPEVLGVCLDTGNNVATDCIRAIKLLARTSTPVPAKVDSDQWTPSQEKQRYAAQRIHTLRLLAGSTGSEWPEVPPLSLDAVDQSLLNKSYISHVHAKSYSIDPTTGPIASVQMEYTHLLWQLFLSHYDGYYSIEYEGQAGYSKDEPRERDQDEADTERNAGNAPEEPPHEKRRANTMEAVRNLKRLIETTYSDYQRDVAEVTP